MDVVAAVRGDYWIVVVVTWNVRAYLGRSRECCTAISGLREVDLVIVAGEWSISAPDDIYVAVAVTGNGWIVLVITGVRGHLCFRPGRTAVVAS